jgi:hypothetical protein
MIGLLKSSSFMPVARHKERAPAILRPAVEVLERYTGMVRNSLIIYQTSISVFYTFRAVMSRKGLALKNPFQNQRDYLNIGLFIERQRSGSSL